MKKTFIVDIDGTICITPKGADGTFDYARSQPLFDRIQKINELYDEGHTIIYWTARGSSSGIDWLNFTIIQLENWKCKYHYAKVGKPSYDVWIDDKAFNSDTLDARFNIFSTGSLQKLVH